jgi:hypothetical protein
MFAVVLHAQELDYTLVLKQGVNGYYGTTDTYIDYDNPNSNYGPVSYIRTYKTSTRIERSGLIKFDLTGQLPQGAVITNAVLSLYAYDFINFVGDDDWAYVGVYRIGQYRDWVESQATWYVFKGSSYWSVAGCEGVPWDRSGTYDSQVYFYGHPTPGYYHWNVTSSVQAWYSGSAPNNGWLIRIVSSYSHEGVDFYSKDHSIVGYRPYLTINYTVIPEPSSLLALSAGLVGLLSMRRRR